MASNRRQDGWAHSSTCRAVEEAGATAGREYGLAEAELETLAERVLSTADWTSVLARP
jgi:hypothetical protein